MARLAALSDVIIIISLVVIAAETLIFSQMTYYHEADEGFISQIYENLQI